MEDALRPFMKEFDALCRAREEALAEHANRIGLVANRGPNRFWALGASILYLELEKELPDPAVRKAVADYAAVMAAAIMFMPTEGVPKEHIRSEMPLVDGVPVEVVGRAILRLTDLAAVHYQK